MDTMMKSIITEKDLLRQILLLEELSNHKTITAKALAASIQTTERTVFTDIQYIREHLPDGWEIEATSNGFSLLKKDSQLTNQLWESFLPLSIGAMLIKQLFFAKGISTQSFLHDSGISFETLKRHVTKINRGIKPYNIRIQLNAKQVKLSGSEISIRVFFHRLLLPFTHNNYFFEDYAIHESHYLIFLQSLKRQELDVLSEEIFGTCWFFINTIRIKANCRVNALAFDPLDPLFLQYQQSLQQVYQKEGVYLNQEECFFSFYCFLESWNYNNNYGQETARCLHHSPFLEVLETFVEELASELSLDQLKKTSLTDNLALLILKYHESPILIEALDRQYHCFLETYDQQYAHLYQQKENLLNDLKKEIEINEPNYFLQLLSLLIQQTIFSIKPNLFNVYFIFQGEPSWKAFLQQELKDYLGKRVCFLPIELTDLSTISFEKTDILISNFPLDSLDIPIVYISSIPTKNELNRLTELTFKTFL